LPTTTANGNRRDHQLLKCAALAFPSRSRTLKVVPENGKIEIAGSAIRAPHVRIEHHQRTRIDQRTLARLLDQIWTLVEGHAVRRGQRQLATLESEPSIITRTCALRLAARLRA
jgi:hypothetical protein